MDRRLVDGLYSLDYVTQQAGSDATAKGLVMLRTNVIFGSDPGGGVVRGELHWDDSADCYRVSGRIVVPPRGVLITDLTAGDDGLDFAFSAVGQGETFVADVAGREIAVALSYLGPLPKELAAANP